MVSRYVVTALGALAPDTRLVIFRRLVVAGPEGLSVGQSAVYVQIAPATRSFHLKELVRPGLMLARHQGRNVYTAANCDTMSTVLSCRMENCCADNAGA
jgi:DNA-binding transcriptional ArsR family regulator